MITDDFAREIVIGIQSRISVKYIEFCEQINKLIVKSKERESKADKIEDKEFHRGVQIGMTHVLILLSKLSL
jgi:hypothetical protein